MRAQHWMEIREWGLAVTTKRGAGDDLLEKRAIDFVVEEVVVVVVKT